MSVLGPSIAKQVKASRGLYKLIKPVADAYASLAGYRQHGLKYDDLLIEENPVVQKVSRRRQGERRAGGEGGFGLGVRGRWEERRRGLRA